MRRILFIILIWTICFIWNKGEAFGSCGPPTNLRVSSVTLQNANFQWNDFNATAPIFWELRLIDLSSVTPDTVYFSSIFVKTFNVTSLLPNNYYEVSVRSYCGTDGFSIWSNYVRFYTHLTNPSKCNMSLPIENNNCSNLFPQKYFINVNNSPDNYFFAISISFCIWLTNSSNVLNFLSPLILFKKYISISIPYIS